MTFYCNSESCISNNGWSSNFFTVHRGVRQGCPLSPYLFVLAVEILAKKIRSNSDTRGFLIKENEIKISQYADDTTLILDGSEKSLSEALKTLESFGNLSGLKLNSKKTETLWVGSHAGSNATICSEYNFNWKTLKVKALGIWFSIHPEVSANLNFQEKIEKMRNCLGAWALRRLSLIGKISVIKSLVVPQIIHILSPLQSNPQIINEINVLFFNFLWNGKGDKIKRDVVIRDYPDGGLKMLDIISFNKALKIVWIEKYLDENSKGKWKLFIDAELEPLGGPVVLNNLNKADTTKVAKGLSPFLKEVLEIWAELNYQDKITSLDSFLAQSLWHNSLIRIMDKPIFYKKWYQSGISCANQFIKEKPNLFFSRKEFEHMHNITVFPLAFCGIISTLKALWRNQARHSTGNVEEQATSVTDILKSKKPNKLAYQKFLQYKSTSPIPSQKKWSNLIQEYHDINWNNAYRLALKCTNSTKLIEFHFRLLHRVLATNTVLAKMGFRNDNKCTFCGKDPEKILHLFWYCNKTQVFWDHLSSFLHQHNILPQNCGLSKLTALGLRPDSSRNNRIVDYISLLARFYIWICRSKERKPTLESFCSYLKLYKEIEPLHINRLFIDDSV